VESSCAEIMERFHREVNANDPDRRHYKLLILQCHSEGVLWNGLLPLLFAKKPVGSSSPCDHTIRRGSRRARRALSIILRHYRYCIQLVQVGSSFDSTHEENACNGDNSAHRKLYWRWYNMKRCNIDSQYITHPNNNDDNIPTIVLLLPHNNLHYYSRTSSARPTNTFALRLISYENAFIKLTSLSAYISTLGGGYFLCRYLSTAIALARRQCAIAIMRGDTDMALKCRINEGYCYIHAGKLKNGKKVIRRVLQDVIQLQSEQGVDASEDGMLHHTPEKELSELTIIKNMCCSALRFANHIHEHHALSSAENGEKENQHQQSSETNGIDDKALKSNEKSVSSTHDDFQRIRIVKDRKWR